MNLECIQYNRNKKDVCRAHITTNRPIRVLFWKLKEVDTKLDIAMKFILNWTLQ